MLISTLLVVCAFETYYIASSRTRSADQTTSGQALEQTSPCKSDASICSDISTIPEKSAELSAASPTLEAATERAVSIQSVYTTLASSVVMQIEELISLTYQERTSLEQALVAQMYIDNKEQIASGEGIPVSKIPNRFDPSIESVIGTQRYNAYLEKDARFRQSRDKEWIEMRVHYLSRKLGLSPEQEPKVAQVYAEVNATHYQDYLVAVTQAGQQQLNYKEDRREIERFRKDMMLSRLRGILTDAQLNRYAEIQESH